MLCRNISGRQFCRGFVSRIRDAWFVGELIHGDYAAVVRETGFDSATQYELWKAIWSGINDGNFFELDHALQRHAVFVESFAPLTFVGNHDVTRIASQLERPEHLAHALVVLMTVGGVPSIYAGDELGYRGVKEERFGGDDAVRPEFGSPPPELDEHGVEIWSLHQYLIGLRRRHPWLYAASTSALRLENRQYVYQTRHGDEALIVALNIDQTPLRVRSEARAGRSDSRQRGAAARGRRRGRRRAARLADSAAGLTQTLQRQRVLLAVVVAVQQRRRNRCCRRWRGRTTSSTNVLSCHRAIRRSRRSSGPARR